MSHSAILDTTLHKTVLKFMLKIISVRHYKKQGMLLSLPKEEIARFLGIMMKVLTPRTLEMSLQRAPKSCTMTSGICCFTYYSGRELHPTKVHG